MTEEQNLTESMLTSEAIYDGEVVHLKKDTVRLPDGKPALREVIRHIGAVCIVPVTEDGAVIVEKQFRYPAGKVLLELPAGKLDRKGEEVLSAAKRELREETGYTAKNWRDLGGFYPTPAYSDEYIELFLATGLQKGEQELDADEFLSVKEEPLSFLFDEVMSGNIEDAKTQIGILRVAAMLLPTESEENWDEDDDVELPDGDPEEDEW